MGRKRHAYDPEMLMKDGRTVRQCAIETLKEKGIIQDEATGKCYNAGEEIPLEEYMELYKEEEYQNVKKVSISKNTERYNCVTFKLAKFDPDDVVRYNYVQSKMNDGPDGKVQWFRSVIDDSIRKDKRRERDKKKSMR